MRRWPSAALGVALVGALLASATPASADTTTDPPPPTTAAQEVFRTSVESMLDGLGGVVATMKADPTTAVGVVEQPTDPSSLVGSAKQQVADMTSTQLDLLKAGLDQYPTWEQMPGQLLSAVQTFISSSPSHAASSSIVPSSAKSGATSALSTSTLAASAAIASNTGTFTSNCTSAGSAPDEFLATEIANEVQSAAQAAMLGVPGVVAIFFVDVPTGVKIALAIVWGIADAIYLGLAEALAVSTDCAQTAFAETQTGSYPVDPADGTTVVAGSSEISIQTLINQSTNTQTEINNVLNTVGVIGGQADTLTGSAAALNLTLNDVLSRLTEVQDDAKLLKTNVDILKSTQTTILGKSNTEITNLSTFQTLQLRMAIEENLSRNGSGTGPVGLYELPALYGGYLEIAKAVTTDTITKETAVGHGSTGAAGDLAAANTAFTKKLYKTAYSYYCKAYRDVTH